MAKEKSHDNMDLCKKTSTLETGEDILHFDNRDLWEIPKFSPPSPKEITLSRPSREQILLRATAATFRQTFGN